MKWLPVICTLLFSFAALAAEDQSKPALKPMAPVPKPGIVIVDGKKFFPLQNARRFTSTGLSPSAQSVMHHPRPQGVIVTRGTRSSPASADSSSSSASTTKAAPDDVLSVFAPDDKGIASSVPSNLSPATPLNAITK